METGRDRTRDPGIAVRHASVARHVTDSATRPGITHSELIVKYNIGLKTLLQQGISEPIFYGDLVYKLKRIIRIRYSFAIIGKTEFVANCFSVFVVVWLSV